MKVEKDTKDTLNIELQSFKDGKKNVYNLIFSVNGLSATVRNVCKADVTHIGMSLVSLCDKME